jgi:hypothetical protein
MEALMMDTYSGTAANRLHAVAATVFFLAFSIFYTLSDAHAAPSLFEQSTITLSVSDPSAVADELIEKAQSMDGYFTHLSDQDVTFRIPSPKNAEFLSYCESRGLVLDRQFETTGYDEQLNQQKTSLKAKQDVLERYLAVLKNTRKKSIVSVERAVQEQVADIETLKGSIAFMEHQLAFTRVTVLFKFKDRSAPAYSGRSSFPWLNTMNLQTMIEDFNHEK